MVPRAQPRSYYGQPIVKEPAWTWEIPCYFFTGGLAGAASLLGLGADLAGHSELGRRAWLVSFAGMAVSPVLLISDLGRPGRFHHMLRVVKPTSPMSLGAWVLSGFGASVPLVVGHELTGRFALLDRIGRVGAGLLGPPLATYTAVLVADTAIPAWHEARFELPFAFAGGAMASAGGVTTLVTPPGHAGPARRLAVIGAALETAASVAMEKRLGELGEVYHQGPAGLLSRAAKACNVAGAALLLRSAPRGPGARIKARRARLRRAHLGGAALVTAGAFLERWAVYRAGFQSARDPKYVVGPQRERLRARGGR